MSVISEKYLWFSTSDLSFIVKAVIIFFWYFCFIILVSFSLTLKEEKVEIEVIEPIIAYSNCEERNYSNIDFLEIKNIQTFLKNENYFAGSINGYKDEFLISSIKPKNSGPTSKTSLFESLIM